MRMSKIALVAPLVLGLCFPADSDAQTQASTAAVASQAALALVGLWGSQQSFGPMVRGELTIDARSAEWRARIAGYDVPVVHTNAHTNVDTNDGAKNEIHFALPGEAGKFRGHLSANGKQILGHWIQLAGVAFYSYSYASPVELSELAPRVWRGNVVPLDERASFYISIQRVPDGAWKVFLRNPEANWFRGQTFDVELHNEDGAVTLSQKGQAQLQGSYDAQTNILSLPVVDSAPPVQFTRYDQSNALGFYPRIPSPSGSYVYRKPAAESDGWDTASLSDVGLELGPIAELIQRILTTPPSLSNPVNMQSLLIARHGKLVFEEYFYGFNKERPHDMRSASKTFGPVLVGLAREHGAKISLDSPAYSFFPQYKPFANWDERKNNITVRDLMTMTSGLACDDHDPSSAGGEDTMQSQTLQNDWYKFALDLPTARDPAGEQAVYCSSDINLVGGIVTYATRSWLPEFFDQYFARPLQITSYHMNLMPTGDAYMGGGLYMRPRDQLKLGQLYLSGGVWNGKRILSEAWVKDSVVRHSGFPPIIPSDTDHGYSYAWHTRRLKVSGREFRDYYAAGNGGQYVLVLPDLDVVVGITGGDYAERDKFFPWESQLVPQYIIPAALTGDHHPR
jgi:CubicO group peptidase (beta-lactamase class C family)